MSAANQRRPSRSDQEDERQLRAGVFFWQPLAPAKRNPSPQERQELALRRNTRSAPLFWQVRKALNERMSPGMFANFHDLSDVFGNEDKTVFKDSIHLLETGNDRVAEAMVQVLRSAVSR